VEVGSRVRLVRTIDLGSEGMVEQGAIGVVETTNNSPYLPYLVEFQAGFLALEDGDIEEVDEQ